MNGRALALEESPWRNRRLAHQAGKRDLLETLAAAHQIRHLIHFHQPVHSAPQAELIAMFLGAEFRIGTDSKSA